MVKTRRKYSAEFKQEAVNLVTVQGYSISEAARNLGIHPNMLGRWKQEMDPENARNPSISDTKSLQAENRRLRKENKRLEMEREILKKAAAFFAKESS
jgi:transposase